MDLNQEDLTSQFSSKLALFKSLLNSPKWDPYPSHKPTPSLLILQDPTLYIKAQKTLFYPLETIVTFLFQAYDKHFLLDERQAKTFFISKVTEGLHLLYYYLKTPGFNGLDAFLLNGVDVVGKEAYVVGFSIEGEGKMLWRLNGYYIKQDAKGCEVINITSRDFGNDRLSLPKFDWNQGSSLDRLANLLSFYNKENLTLPIPKSVEEILKEISFLEDADKGKNDEWIEKYRESLKPGPEEFENIEKLDLFNLFGEPYKEKPGRRTGGKIKGELPKSMAGKINNNRTKEYFASLLSKTKK